jgi:hypothetical protein
VVDSRETFQSAGYFTWLAMLYNTPSHELETAIGYSGGSLRNGWKLFTPRFPIAAANIDLRGSTRYSDGKMPDGRQIEDVLAARTDVAAARKKVASFFDRGLDRRPVKIVVKPAPISYPPAPNVGRPQFKLMTEVEWVFVLDVPAGSVLTRATAASARW